MLKTLKNANFARNVIVTNGKTFSMDEMAKVLCYQNEKFSILYNKYFYGFEKEGKSNYFLDNAVEEGVYFNFKFPLNELLLPLTMVRAINLPLGDDTVAKHLKQKSKG
jgi:hypothetical protein